MLSNHLRTTSGHLGRPSRTGLAVLLLATSLVPLSALTDTASAAQPPVNLGTAASFGLLAGSAVTNTGPSTINGDLGVGPGSAISGFPPGHVNGTTHDDDAAAAQAQQDLTTAYNSAAGRTPASSVPADLGGQTLTPGVYRSASSLGLTGAVTLDAQGDPNAVFIFQASSSLTTASNSRVNLINGAQPCNVTWQVGSSATLGTGSQFSGSILALTSITLNDSVTVAGRTLARNGAVTLINNSITSSNCATGATTTGGGGPGTGTGAGTGTGTGTGTPTGPGSTAVGSGGSSVKITSSPRRCVQGSFRATVTGRHIRRVVFTTKGRVIATVVTAPFVAVLRATQGVEVIAAKVSFNDGTPARVLRVRFHGCAPTPSRAPRTRAGFTG